MPTDFYDVLGAPADASSDELKRAYRDRVRKYHPDVNDHRAGDSQFKLVRKAHDVLSDPAERKDYDRMGHREYVDKRLDDLPPISVFPETDESLDSEGAEPVDSPGSVGSDRSSPQRGTGSSTKKHSTSRSASSNSSRSSSRSRSGDTRDSRGSPSSDTTSTGNSRSTGDNRSAENSQAAGGSRSRASTQSTSRDRSADRSRTGTTDRTTGTTSAGADRSKRSWDDLTETARAGTTRSSNTAGGARRRRGLRRWYGVVLLSLLVYVGGLGTYAASNMEPLTALAGGLTAAPVATLAGMFPLPSLTAYVLETVTAAAAGEPGVGLLLLVGVVVLPAVVLTAVAQFGQGSAWVYALASLGPVTSLGAGAVAPFPTALALVGLVLLPLFSGIGFLVDVGRYLYATR